MYSVYVNSCCRRFGTTFGRVQLLVHAAMSRVRQTAVRPGARLTLPRWVTSLRHNPCSVCMVYVPGVMYIDCCLFLSFLTWQFFCFFSPLLTLQLVVFFFLSFLSFIFLYLTTVIFIFPYLSHFIFVFPCPCSSLCLFLKLSLLLNYCLYLSYAEFVLLSTFTTCNI